MTCLSDLAWGFAFWKLACCYHNCPSRTFQNDCLSLVLKEGLWSVLLDTLALSGSGSRQRLKLPFVWSHFLDVESRHQLRERFSFFPRAFVFVPASGIWKGMSFHKDNLAGFLAQTSEASVLGEIH